MTTGTAEADRNCRGGRALARLQAMSTASIHDRGALERAYPRDAFAGDAAQNDSTASAVRRGVRVLSAPDAAGEFGLERASRQVGEAASAAVFLAPRRRAGGAGSAAGSGGPDPYDGYEEFLDAIIAAARQFGFAADESPGRGDPRIRGLRQ